MWKTYKKRIIGFVFSVIQMVLISDTTLAKEYLLTSARPDKLYMIDMEDGSIAASYKIPGQTFGTWSIVVAPDNNVVYVSSESHETLVGINLDSGEIVFKAALSQDDVRVKSFYGHDISPDGRKLYAYVHPVKLLSDEVRVMENQVFVFDISDGLDARPIRSFPAPRRVFQMMASSDGNSLFLAGWDLYKLDATTGRILETFPINNWTIEDRSVGNAYGHWANWEQSGKLTMATASVHTDRNPASVEAYQSSVVQIDRNTGEFDVWDFEYTEDLIFSMVSSPVKPEVFATYNSLAKIDSAEHKTILRVPLEMTYYSINISGDGETVFLGGGGCRLAAHRSTDLSRKWGITLPGCADQSFSQLRIINR